MSQLSVDREWVLICPVESIMADSGVCALVAGEQVAVFRVAGPRGGCFAIGNIDPLTEAAVLSRGLVGSLGDRIVIASPLHKQHFDLRTGECLEDPALSVPTFPVREKDGQVWVAARQRESRRAA